MSETPASEDLEPIEDQGATAVEEPQYGQSIRELPEQVVNALKAAIKKFTTQEQYIRRREVLRDRQNRFYERGYQHIYEMKSGAFAQAAPGAAITTADGSTEECPSYIDDYPIFEAYERIIISVLTQSEASIVFRPDSQDSSEDIEAANACELSWERFRRTNDIQEIARQIVRMMCLSSRTITWTRTEDDAQKWGTNPATGQPKCKEITTVHGTLESRVPIMCKSLAESPYMALLDDPDILLVKQKYDWVKSKLKAGSSGLGENAYERLARLGVLQGSRSQAQMGDAFSHLVTRGNWWFRPMVFSGPEFEEPMEEQQGEQPQTVGDWLLASFPDGIRTVFCGEQFCEAYAECLDDHLEVGFPYPGDGMFRLAIMDPAVVDQDRFNDNMNAFAEIADVCWPSTWISVEDQDYDAIAEQKASPGAIRNMKLPTGVRIQDRLIQESWPQIPESIMGWNGFIQGELLQFQLACPPALYGESMQDQKTASGYAQAKSQAQGQQALWFKVLQQFNATIARQSALCAARNPEYPAEIVVPMGQQTAILNLDALGKGNFGVYPDKDNGMPESTDDKRRVLTAMLADPVISPTITASPDNVKTIVGVLGFQDLSLPEVEARDKQMFEIEQLLKGEPIPPDPEMLVQAQQQHAAQSVAASATGQAEPAPFDAAALITPTVPVQELDFHQWEFAKCQEWLSSEARRKEDAKGNQAGVQNVILHAKQHQQFVQQQQMAAAAITQMGNPQPAQPGAPAPQTL